MTEAEHVFRDYVMKMRSRARVLEREADPHATRDEDHHSPPGRQGQVSQRELSKQLAEASKPSSDGGTRRLTWKGGPGTSSPRPALTPRRSAGRPALPQAGAWTSPPKCLSHGEVRQIRRTSSQVNQAIAIS
jgi:hypothetical protein